jgi:hypothetical protein
MPISIASAAALSLLQRFNDFLKTLEAIAKIIFRVVVKLRPVRRT